MLRFLYLSSCLVILNSPVSSVKGKLNSQIEDIEEMKSRTSKKPKGIVVIEEDRDRALRKSSLPLTQEYWALAKETAEKLLFFRKHELGGGAGLAACQIGINHPIFIFTSDRTDANLKVVINPSFEPIGTEKVTGEEACFSVPLSSAKVARWKKIKVKYLNLEGEIVEEILDGFAAKVFQHEMDHLNGKLTVDHEEAEVQSFPDEPSFDAHMEEVFLKDAERYNKR